MNLEEIKSAVLSGKKVYWGPKGYEVIRDNIGQWLIWCKDNDHYSGLTWLDGVTMNGKPEDFFIEGNNNAI